MRRAARHAAAALLLAVTTLQGHADTDAATAAGRAALMLQEAATALAEADGARDRVEALTETVRAYEEGLLALREGVRQAALRERAILLVFETERDRLARLLAVLQTIQSSPGPALLLHPEGPLGTARAGMIVSDVTPAVARQAQALRAQLEELALLRAVQDDSLTQLSDGLRGVQEARSALSQAIADRRELPAPFALDSAAMQSILRNATSLDSFAELLRELPSTAPDDIPDFREARGGLQAPVLGTVLRRYGESDAAGVARPGLVLASRPRALVTTPWPASVRYVGPLLDYGNVIIIEPEADYLIITAGLGEVFVEAGQLVPGDTPLGLMPGPEGAGEDLILPDGDGSGVTLSETLYLELRENGRPVDPEDWFALE
ncbi:peptidase M23 [Roseibacterium sp. SDUM158017]|uniref:murein hydrolase activator EnvC family protein n=1 Tax=Roseicyclus salinarum TaxID=3036773 RepID=UPI00241518BB|nr:peptidase M23 [Roseibacterium sp. SDUM158017]MDG4647053.1 peptidase M23 [Roseibacterium sp. SDUM158017]